MNKTVKTSALHRFYIKAPLENSQTILIEGEEAHHLRKVLRLKVGDTLAAFDGRGSSYIAQIREILKDQVRAEILDRRLLEGESPLTLHLVQSLLRAERMDWVVQKAVELGVSRITPLITARSLVKLTLQSIHLKQERWQRIAKEAGKQCSRSCLPEVEPPLCWEEWIKGPFAEQGRFFFYEGEKKGKIKILGRKMRGLNTVQVVLGPEGGWEPQEAEALKSQGFLALSLGPRILRAETATVAALSLLQYIFGDLS